MSLANTSSRNVHKLFLSLVFFSLIILCCFCCVYGNENSFDMNLCVIRGGINSGVSQHYIMSHITVSPWEEVCCTHLWKVNEFHNVPCFHEWWDIRSSASSEFRLEEQIRHEVSCYLAFAVSEAGSHFLFLRWGED